MSDCETLTVLMARAIEIRCVSEALEEIGEPDMAARAMAIHADLRAFIASLEQLESEWDKLDPTIFARGLDLLTSRRREEYSRRLK